MQNDSFTLKALAFARDAVEADSKNDLAVAFSAYSRALAYFNMARKYSATEQTRCVLTETMKKYLARAEEIKAVLDGARKPVVVAAGSGASPPLREEKSSVADGEAAKLMASLGSAIVSERPNVQWDEVAGLTTAKDLLKEAVVLPVRFPQLFQGNRKPWQAILMFGVPGTGKSFLAKAVATECGASCFLSVSSSDLVSKYLGESEKLVRGLFDLARLKQPSIIFIDEIDSLCSSRGDGENESARRIKTEFLVQMQGVGKNNKGVLVLAATNTPWDLDQAMRRRFDKRVYIPLPDAAARTALFRSQIALTPHSLTHEQFLQLGRMTQGYSGSDIAVVVRDALYEPVRTVQLATHFKKVPSATLDYLLEPCSPSDPDGVEMSLTDVPSERLKPLDLNMRHFEMVLRNSKATVSASDLTKHEQWTSQFGLEGS